MTQPQIHIHSDLEELSRAAADRFAELAQERMSEAGTFCVALSGGSTPRRLYELLGSDFSGRLEWSKVQLFQVDERMVAHDHAASNFRMIRESLLARAPVPAENVHRLEGELEPEQAAARYAQALESNVPRGGQGIPRFDLILLGMGPDGHVASIFPHSKLLDEQTRWTAVSEPGPEGLSRVTLTLPVLNAAAEIIFLVSGGEKSETLARVLAGAAAQELLPVELVLRSGVPINWYVDRAAASKLG